MANQINKEGINTGITWCHYSANLWWGCTKVHEGCTNCYAETTAKRWGQDVWGNDAPRRIVKSAFSELDKFQVLAKSANEMHRVFVGSMKDIFEKSMPVVDINGNLIENMTTGILRNELFSRISLNRYPNLMFLFLTKRPSNINKMIPEQWLENPPSNVMYGTSVVNQTTANQLVPQLLKVNGKRFLSIEPQIDFIDLNLVKCERFGADGDMCQDSCYFVNGGLKSCSSWLNIHWVIQGGESGPNRRPFNLEWATFLKKQCQSAHIPYFFKQIDQVIEKTQGIPEHLQIREFPEYHSLN